MNVDDWNTAEGSTGAWLGRTCTDANGRRSYAAGYPDAQDLFLAAAVEVDPETGEFMTDVDGNL